MLTIPELIAHLRRAAVEFRPALEAETLVLMEEVAADARNFIGNEQPGWDPLAQATLDDKQRQGYPTPYPLLREGALRDSITSAVEPTAEGVRGIVGSTDPTAIYHEIGTSKEPPRPFLGPAFMQAEPKIATALELVLRALKPGSKL